MKILKYFATITMAMFLSTGWAGEQKAPVEKPRIYSSQTMQVNLLVEAVDYETREVTLLDPDGKPITFTAGPEVRNLAQMQAGDVVYAEHTQSYSIEVFENKGMAPSELDLTAVGAAEEGDKPGLTAIDTQVITATVEAIDLETNKFSLKWPDDSIEEFTAQNPENLRKAAVGDLVVITVTEALDISVEEPQAE
jgi:hypothetical protein